MESDYDRRILVRVPKGRRKLGMFVGYLDSKPPQFMYSFRFSGHFVYVNGAEYERVKHLVTKARVDISKLLNCWITTQEERP